MKAFVQYEYKWKFTFDGLMLVRPEKGMKWHFIYNFIFYDIIYRMIFVKLRDHGIV